MKITKIVSVFLIIFTFILVPILRADDLTSTNFIIYDPVIGTGGGYGTSTNFQLNSSTDELLNGTNSSTNFIGRYGFLYYPFVEAGVLTATAVSSDINLSWGASVAGQGWDVSGYNTGKASVSGGPYTYTSVGNVTSYSYTELAPGEYCFVVQTLDSLGYVISTSNEDCDTVLPVITFDIDTSVADGETSTPYSVALGSITTTDTRVSGSTDSVNMIIMEANSNAVNGVVVTVKNTNGGNGLVSTSVPGDNINSADGTMADGTENYGLCVITAGLSGFARISPYDSGACATNSETNAVQGLTSTGENILTSSSSPVYNAHAEISVNGAISGVTPAHADYTDALTFIATGTF
ncbi:MAG: hypothetical protein KBD52_01810 [Candidatus Pacebacteria bacterium]|nr:hypothetical protein [Candidatus Paceibacterota bacterium]